MVEGRQRQNEMHSCSACLSRSSKCMKRAAYHIIHLVAAAGKTCLPNLLLWQKASSIEASQSKQI